MNKNKNIHNQWRHSQAHRNSFMELLQEECGPSSLSNKRSNKFLSSSKKGDMRILDNLITWSSETELEEIESNLRPCALRSIMRKQLHDSDEMKL